MKNSSRKSTARLGRAPPKCLVSGAFAMPPPVEIKPFLGVSTALCPGGAAASVQIEWKVSLTYPTSPSPQVMSNARPFSRPAALTLEGRREGKGRGEGRAGRAEKHLYQVILVFQSLSQMLHICYSIESSSKVKNL